MANKLKEPYQINILIDHIDLPSDGRLGAVESAHLDHAAATSSHIERLLINMLTNIISQLNNKSGFVDAIYDAIHDDSSSYNAKELNKCFIGNYLTTGIEFGVRIMVGEGMDVYNKNHVTPVIIPVIRMDVIYSPDKSLNDKVWEL